VTIVAGLLFGAIDQYLGTVHVTSRLGWWTITVSGMSAPWLVLPFLAGITQDRWRRAAALGLVVTLSALVGYFAMSNSAFEGVPIARFWPRTITMIRSEPNPLWILGGMVAGPLYAYFGHRWRVARSWLAAVLVTCALWLEPLVRSSVHIAPLGTLGGSPVVWWAEVVLGVAAAVFFITKMTGARRVRGGSPPPPR